MKKLCSIQFICIYLALWTLLIPAGFAVDLGVYKDADYLLYSGEISWKMEYEAIQPASPVDEKHRPIGLSDEAFSAWQEKLKGPRKQTFNIHAVFQSDNLRFECQSAPGDVLPQQCDRILTFNRVSITKIDNALANIYRQPIVVSYRENHFSNFYYPPRACGYDAKLVLKLAQKVKDVNGKTATSFNSFIDADKENAIVLNGTFDGLGVQKLAELIPDKQFGQVLKTIKYICPMANARVIIENSELKSYPDGTVFPGKTVIRQYADGSLDEPEKGMFVSRITLTLQEAKFGGTYDDELFNPGRPQGYKDLDDIRGIIRNKLLNP